MLSSIKQQISVKVNQGSEHMLMSLILTASLSTWHSSYTCKVMTANGEKRAYSTLYSLTHSLIPWCRVLLEQLTGLQLVKKFPAFHGTRRFITALTSVRHLSLSWACPIQSTYPHPTSWRFILILSNHLRLGLLSAYSTLHFT